jgi:hypothetical protein
MSEQVCATGNEYYLLNKRMAGLVDLIGMDATLLLVKHYGGTHLNIPKKAKPDHNLVSLIGLSTFQALCLRYGSTKLEIDLCITVLRQQQKQRILADVERGMTNAQVARKHNTTERQVKRIKQKASTKTHYNLDIFEMIGG